MRKTPLELKDLLGAFEDLALAPAIAVSDDIASVEGANVVTRRLGDDVVKGGVDQVVPLRRQRRLGPVVFDIVRSPGPKRRSPAC
jgi:hypothetical protein